MTRFIYHINFAYRFSEKRFITKKVLKNDDDDDYDSTTTDVTTTDVTTNLKRWKKVFLMIYFGESVKKGGKIERVGFV